MLCVGFDVCALSMIVCVHALLTSLLYIILCILLAFGPKAFTKWISNNNILVMFERKQTVKCSAESHGTYDTIY